MRSRGLALLLFWPAVVSAASSLRFTAQAAAGPTTVTVSAGGTVVLRLRHGSAPVAWQLAAEVVRRLDQLAEAGVGPEAFALAQSGDGPAVTAGGGPVVTANAAAVDLAGQTGDSLARTWLANLRQAFSRDYVSVPGERLVVPLGEVIQLQARGRPAGQPARWTVTPADRLAVADGADGRTIGLRGAALGAAEVTVQLGSATLVVPAEVLRRAGRIIEPVVVYVAGSDLPAGLLTVAVESQLRPAAVVEPGARMRFALPSRWSSPAPGGRATLPVAVKIEGPGLLPLDTAVQVVLERIGWEDQPSQWLLVSNDPESVRATQLLLRGRLPARQQTRLLYHHQTASISPLTYEIRLANPSEQPARVLLRDASAGPTPFAELAGHLAAKRYWQQRLAGQGVVVFVPPKTSWTITGAVCRRGEVFSGLSELAPLDDTPVELQVIATAGEVQLGARPLEGESVVPYSDMFRFAEPQVSAEYVYRPGGMYAFMNVGREPLKSVLGPPLMGNYGVVYHLSVEFHNTTEQPGRYELVLSADGGPALGTLVIDGRLYETKPLKGGQQERLLDLSLAPDQRRRLSIRILPESGSNYPLRLVGRPYTAGWSGRGRP